MPDGEAKIARDFAECDQVLNFNHFWRFIGNSKYFARDLNHFFQINSPEKKNPDSARALTF